LSVHTVIHQMILSFRWWDKCWQSTLSKSWNRTHDGKHSSRSTPPSRRSSHQVFIWSHFIKAFVTFLIFCLTVLTFVILSLSASFIAFSYFWHKFYFFYYFCHKLYLFSKAIIVCQFPILCHTFLAFVTIIMLLSHFLSFCHNYDTVSHFLMFFNFYEESHFKRLRMAAIWK